MPIPHQIAFIALTFVLSCAPIGSYAAGDQTIAISANDQMKYNVTDIAGKVGQTMIITLTNDGSLMPHNLVILKPGADVTAFAASASKCASDGYLPNDEQAAQMIVHTKFLDGGENDKISFTPAVPGVYEYLCTYPGHTAAGMRGKINVQ